MTKIYFWLIVWAVLAFRAQEDRGIEVCDSYESYIEYQWRDDLDEMTRWFGVPSGDYTEDW